MLYASVRMCSPELKSDSVSSPGVGKSPVQKKVQNPQPLFPGSWIGWVTPTLGVSLANHCFFLFCFIYGF